MLCCIPHVLFFQTQCFVVVEEDTAFHEDSKAEEERAEWVADGSVVCEAEERLALRKEGRKEESVCERRREEKEKNKWKDIINNNR